MPKVTMIPATINPLTHLPSVAARKRRVAGYARVSTDSDEQFTSYEAQVDYYTKFIQSKPEWEFVKVYTDEGISGTNTKRREGFKEMITDALDGKIDLIVTKSVSRFARNTVDSLVTIRKLKENGVECYFEKEGIYTFDGKGELLITIMSSLAQEESRSISENITWGQRKSFSDGKVHLPYKRFLGYEKGEDGRPAVVESEARVVKLIYGLFLEGKTQAGICKYLEELGIPSPGGKQTWSKTTITSILQNEKYKGDALLQKKFTVDFLEKKMKPNEGEVPQYYVTGSHPAIIEPDEWEQVQAEFARRKTLGKAYSGKSVLSAKLVCEDCGAFFGPKVWHSTDQYRRTIWQCNGKFANEERCHTPVVDTETIQRLFIKAYNLMIYDYANGVSYSLEDRGVFDYTLWQNESDGQLYVDKSNHIGGDVVASGRLTFQDECIQMVVQSIPHDAILEIINPTDDPNFAYDTAVEKIYEDEVNEYFIGGLYSQHIIVRYTDGTQEDIKAALNSGRATLADLDKFGIRYWAEPKVDPLDAAISTAILEHYRSDKPDGLIYAESHVLLANEVVSGTPLFGADDHAEKVTAYILVHHVKYSTYGGALETVGGSYVPTAITFKISDSGEYILEEYWEPRDGSYYAKDIRDKFPGASADDALNDQAYIEDLKAQTYNKALAYLNNNISLDVRIAELLGTIQSSPAQSSNPGDYIRAHETEYNELLGYGEFTLRYCFSEFLQGGQMDLRGHIMALACEDIMLSWGEAYTIDGVPFTGQDRFDEFRRNAESLADQFSPEDLEKNFPGAFLLLQMSSDAFATKGSPN